MKKTWITLARLAAILVLFAVAAELGLRALRFSYPPLRERAILWSRAEDPELIAGTGLHVIDRHELWRPRPGAPIPWARPETVNAASFRGPELALARAPGILRIAVLGDAASFGMGVPWRDMYAAQLVNRLEYGGIQAEVLCAAVIGSTLRQGLERYRQSVRPYQPDLVVCAYDGDDEHRAAPIGCSDAERIEGVCGPFSSPTSELPAALAPLRASPRIGHALGWLWDIRGGTYWRERDDVLQERRLARYETTFDVAGERRVSHAEFLNCFVTLKREVVADGAELLLLRIPTRTGLTAPTPAEELYANVLSDVAHNEQLYLVDGRAAFARSARTGIAVDDFFLSSSYPSDCGHSILAQALADEILARRDEYRR